MPGSLHTVFPESSIYTFKSVQVVLGVLFTQRYQNVVMKKTSKLTMYEALKTIKSDQTKPHCLYNAISNSFSCLSKYWFFKSTSAFTSKDQKDWSTRLVLDQTKP